MIKSRIVGVGVLGAFVTLAVASVGFAGCGSDGGSGGGGGIVIDIDAGPGNGDGGGGAVDCNPVANSGCPAEQKCTFVVESTDPVIGRTACAPVGDKEVGTACTRDDVSGSDDCVGGAYCQNDICRSICSSAPDSCGTEATCIHVNNVFADDNLGFCNPPCDIFAQDCLNDEACYIIISRPGAPTICAPARTEPGNENPGRQGEECNFINTCEKGYGCILNNQPMDATGLECAFLCDPSGGGGPSCAVDGPGPAFDCRQVNMFYESAVDVPDGVGFCVDPLEYPAP